MIRPDRAKSFSEAMRICFVVIKNLSKLIKSKGLSTSVGDEGGFAPMINNNNHWLFYQYRKYPHFLYQIHQYHYEIFLIYCY